MNNLIKCFVSLSLLSLVMFGCEKNSDSDNNPISVYSNPELVGLWECAHDSTFLLEFTNDEMRSGSPDGFFRWEDYIAESDSILKMASVRITYDSLTHETTSTPIWITMPYKVSKESFWWNYGISGCEVRYKRIR